MDVGAFGNRLRYTLWAPIYDVVVLALRRYRRRSIESLALQPGQRLVILGAGTGEDLPFVPAGVEVVATDLTPAMLARARRKARPEHVLSVMDARDLKFPDGAFDAALLHLILAVMPEPERGLAEAARVVRPGGRIAVMDKFVRAGTQPSLVRRLANVPLSLIATDITRRFEDVLVASGAPVVVEHDEAHLGGNYRLILLRRTLPSE